MNKTFLAISLLIFSQKSFSQSTTATNLLSGTSSSTPGQFLGSNNAYDVILKSNNIERMRVLSSGAIGIGTSSPATGVGFHCNAGLFRITDPASATRGLQVTPNFATASGEMPAGTVLLTPINTSGEGLSLISSGSGASGVKIGTYVYSQYAGWRSVWETQNFGVGLPQLYLVKSGGQVAVGSSYVPSGYMMSINGALIATDIVVQLRSNWPDYVFSKEYKLTPLKELEQYINTEKHLPEIPEAKSMEKDGIDVAKINILLTKKVEELTLYMIELNKTNEFLSKRISELENTLTKK